jgi:hypothetical protein
MLKLYGVSDDLVELYGAIEDEFANQDVFVIGQCEATQGVSVHGVMVRMVYAPAWAGTAVWVAEVSPIEEDAPIPWTVTVTLGDRGYSAEVTIDCPPETPVTVLRDGQPVWRNGEWLDTE